MISVLSTVEDITDRLVRDYDPDRIIVYGSHAHGSADAGSDVDVLVLKSTDLRPIERRAEVERLLSDRAVAIDITVYTPEELRHLFAIGSPFAEEVMETGRLVYMRKATEAWIEAAEDELRSAEILLEHGGFKGACYHAQQSAEKGLKALILERGERPGRVHDILKLRKSVQDLGWDIELDLDDAVFLNSIYKGRYPTEDGLLPHGDPTTQDAERLVDAAKRFLGSIRAALP